MLDGLLYKLSRKSVVGALMGDHTAQVQCLMMRWIGSEDALASLLGLRQSPRLLMDERSFERVLGQSPAPERKRLGSFQSA